MAADRVSLILHSPIYFCFDQMEEVKEEELQTRRPIRLNLTVFHVCASSISLEDHKYREPWRLPNQNPNLEHADLCKPDPVPCISNHYLFLLFFLKKSYKNGSLSGVMK